MTEVQLHINLKYNQLVFLNPERINLLRSVQQNGSLNAASKEMSISYQHAWSMIKDINQLAPQPLVVKQRGGSGGGGAVMSDYGALILKEYTFIEQKIAEFTRQLNVEINL